MLLQLATSGLMEHALSKLYLSVMLPEGVCHGVQAPTVRPGAPPTPALIKAARAGAPLSANRFNALSEAV